MARLGVAAGELAIRPAAGAWLAAQRLQRAALRHVTAEVGRRTVVLLDGALTSPYADDAVTRVLDSAVVARAVDHALSGPLVGVVSRDLVRFEVVERVTQEVLAGGVLDRAFDRLDVAGAAQLVADRLLARGIAEQLAARLLEGPELERIVELVLESPRSERLLTAALESPGTERMLSRVVESRVIDDAVARIADDVVGRMRDSEAMWTLIDDIAQSQAVSDAITQQGSGFADQVADEIRERSRTADARLERAAWRLLRRRPRASVDEAPSAT